MIEVYYILLKYHIVELIVFSSVNMMFWSKKLHKKVSTNSNFNYYDNTIRMRQLQAFYINLMVLCISIASMQYDLSPYASLANYLLLILF